MSFWAKVGIQIKDLEVFEKVCEKSGVKFQAVNNADKISLISDKGNACLTKEKNHYRLYMDSDKTYSGFAREYGEDGGKLLQAYSVAMIEKQTVQAGGMILRKEKQGDGSIHLRIAA